MNPEAKNLYVSSQTSAQRRTLVLGLCIGPSARYYFVGDLPEGLLSGAWLMVNLQSRTLSFWA